MGHLQHSDRRQQERSGKAPAEELDRRVARGNVVQDARDDPQAIESVSVGAHRPLETGAAGDVGERLRTHSLACTFLKTRWIDRNAAPRAAHCSEVDIRLRCRPVPSSLIAWGDPHARVRP
jgi:hypothetical protein